LEVKAYIGIDVMSRLTERVLREFQLYVAEVYGIKVDISIVELPLADGEGGGEIPLTMIDGRVVAAGEPPSITRLIDEMFQCIELEHIKTIMGFPVLEEEILVEF
jgi:hypothetical protein